MAQGQVARVSLKVKVLSGVSQPVVTLPLQMTYKDSDGSTYEAAANNILYLEVTLPKEEKEPAEPLANSKEIISWQDRERASKQRKLVASIKADNLLKLTRLCSSRNINCGSRDRLPLLPL